MIMHHCRLLIAGAGIERHQSDAPAHVKYFFHFS